MRDLKGGGQGGRGGAREQEQGEQGGRSFSYKNPLGMVTASIASKRSPQVKPEGMSNS